MILIHVFLGKKRETFIKKFLEAILGKACLAICWRTKTYKIQGV